MQNSYNKTARSRLPIDYNNDTQSPVPSRGFASSITNLSYKPSPNLNVGKIGFLGFIFMLHFSAYNGVQNLITLVYYRLGLNQLGTVALISYYFFFGFSSTIAHKCATVLQYKFTFVLSCCTFIIFMLYCRLAVNCVIYDPNDILTDNIFRPGSRQCLGFYLDLGMIMVAGIAGFGASVLWVAQGLYVAECANVNNKGKVISRFWAFFQSSGIIGNLLASLIYKDYGPDGLFEIMMGILIFSSILYFFVREPEKFLDETGKEPKLIEFIELNQSDFSQRLLDEKDIQNEPLQSQTQNINTKRIVSIVKNNENIWSRTVAFSLQQRFKVFIPLFLISSYSMCMYISLLSIYTEKSVIDLPWEHRIEKVGYVLFALGLFVVLSGQVFNYLCDKDRVLAVKVMYGANFMAFLMITIAYLTEEYWFFLLAAIFFGISDSGSQTVMRVLLSIKFSEKLEPFAAFRWLWCSSLGLFLFINIWLNQITFILSCLLYLGLILFGITRISRLFSFR